MLVVEEPAEATTFVSSKLGRPELAATGKARAMIRLKTTGTDEFNIVLSLSKTMPLPGMDHEMLCKKRVKNRIVERICPPWVR